MKIALAQVNPILGNFSHNRQIAEDQMKSILADQPATDLILFPECSFFGYHPVDLLERSEIVDLQLREITKFTKKIPEGIRVLVGAITHNKNMVGKPFKNSALLLQKNKILKTFEKELLPTYDIFDEARHIEPGDTSKNLFRWKGKSFLVTICEDIWGWKKLEKGKRTYYHHNPLLKVPKEKVDVVLNLSASPFSGIKWSQRMAVADRVVKHFKAPLFYCNMVGAQDELVFDGHSFVMNPKQEVVAKACGFTQDRLHLDLNEPAKKINKKSPLSKVELKRKAIVLGIRDFVEKTKFKQVHLGLSGGIDSSVVSALAVEAVGSEHVTHIALPGPFTSEESIAYAEEQCKNLGAEFIQIPIEDTYSALLTSLKDQFGNFQFGLVNENLQARSRGIILMAYSNLKGSLLLNTSNKSELAMGYSTLYGDLVGGLSPIGDLVKGEVYQLAELINREYEVIPKFIIERPPSAELKPGQKDEDTLPKYELLDRSVKSLIEDIKKPKGSLDRRVINALMKTEFKRWQAPPIVRVSNHAFGRGRRLPIAHQYAVD